MKKGLTVTCAVVTHRHLDHSGGTVRVRGQTVVVQGVSELLARKIPVKMGRDDVEATKLQAALSNNDTIVAMDDMDEVFPGIICLHTPGHTPGSVCLLVDNNKALITGDTLFIDSCGRVDLAESDPVKMMHSLARLSTLAETCVVYPGHNYASLKQSTIKREKERNVAMRQAMTKSSGLTRNNISSNEQDAIMSSNLPDYLSACRKVLQKSQQAQ
jgi:hydroxyacylglutathione hydrolase